ncbi:MAG TPA: DUF4287 domain-containing protein [Planctomycetota bacterium]|nr:DUF4287 domain-containing protein [Planctomycetota bacterium]
MAKSPEQIVQQMLANMQAKTGRSLEQWLQLARGSGGSKHGEIVGLLKREHGLGHAYANLVAQRALGAPASAEQLLRAQYQGVRAALKPIHDSLVAAAKRLGADVEVSVKKTGVSLRRARQFALIQPATNTRIDLGLKLDGVPFAGRLDRWPNTMCSHRVRLATKAEVDRQLLGWLAKAYADAN